MTQTVPVRHLTYKQQHLGGRHAMPVPVTVTIPGLNEPREVSVGGTVFSSLIGFVESPNPSDEQIRSMITEIPVDPSVIVGMFPVMADEDGIYSDLRPVEEIISDEVVVRDGEEVI